MLFLRSFTKLSRGVTSFTYDPANSVFDAPSQTWKVFTTKAQRHDDMKTRKRGKIPGTQKQQRPAQPPHPPASRAPPSPQGEEKSKAKQYVVPSPRGEGGTRGEAVGG